MSFEVVYTSVRRGLRTGAKGFCTVAATEGIPRALHDKLESLSGYRHTEAAAGSIPPVNHSHLIVRIQRQVFHVLSRIGDAGIDYSGRTNKIAHHLALTSEEAERFPAGPGPLLADDGFWFDRWDHEPEELPPGRLPDAGMDSADDFSTWESVFGDAGWAGVLGQSVADGMKPVSIIVPNGNHTRDLLAEALQLVPADQRWRLCFSTYFSRLASGTQCHWRFVLDGTGEARRLRARSSLAVMDYSGGTLPLTEDNPFVQAARTGRPELAHAVANVQSRRRPASGRVSRDAAGDTGMTRRSGRTRRGQAAESRPRPVTAANPFDYNEADFEPAEEQTDRSVRSSPGSGRLGLWLVLVLFLAVVGVLAFFGIQQLS
ncbi:MAG: hypothetical protein RIK87_09230 [Fuerstiella sp.]